MKQKKWQMCCALLLDWFANIHMLELIQCNMPIGRLTVAGMAHDASIAHSNELLATINTLPQDTQAVSQLLKQGCLPVPHHNLAAFSDLTRGLLVGSSGRLADFCSVKIFQAVYWATQVSSNSLQLTGPLSVPAKDTPH